MGQSTQSVLPLDFEIDYVRLYQDVTDGRRARLQCSPDDHPTKEWIDGHHLDCGLPGASFVSITGKASTAANSSHSSHSMPQQPQQPQWFKQAPLDPQHPSLSPIHKHTQTLSRPLYACSASSSHSQAHSSYDPYSSYSKPLPSAYLAVYVSSQLSGCNRRQPSSSHQSTSPHTLDFIPHHSITRRPALQTHAVPPSLQACSHSPLTPPSPSLTPASTLPHPLHPPPIATGILTIQITYLLHTPSAPTHQPSTTTILLPMLIAFTLPLIATTILRLPHPAMRYQPIRPPDQWQPR